MLLFFVRYLDVVPVVVGAQVHIGGPGGGDDGQTIRESARRQHGVQKVVPPAVPLEQAAQPLVPLWRSRRFITGEAKEESTAGERHKVWDGMARVR